MIPLLRFSVFNKIFVFGFSATPRLNESITKETTKGVLNTHSFQISLTSILLILIVLAVVISSRFEKGNFKYIVQE